jgi:two-component system response regulator NreC
MKRIRILLADDHEVVRAAIRGLLRKCEECEICGEAVDGRQAIEKTMQLRPDLILLDISFPDISGLEVALVIRKEAPECRILVVSQHDPDHMRTRALTGGAQGFVSKASLSRDLISAIRAVIGGDQGPGGPSPNAPLNAI